MTVSECVLAAKTMQMSKQKEEKITGKRLLLHNISEVCDSFKKESSFIAVLSKFTSWTPQNDLPITPYDQEVCVCKYDENS